MTTANKTILIGEDDSEVRGYLEMATRCMGFDVILAQDGEKVLSCLRSETVDGVPLGIIMPRTRHRNSPRNTRLESLPPSDYGFRRFVHDECGAGDEDWGNRLPAEAHKPARAQSGQKAIEPEPVISAEYKESVGESGKTVFGRNRRMQDFAQMLRDVAPWDAPVLIRSETRAGKEVIARELHRVRCALKKDFSN